MDPRLTEIRKSSEQKMEGALHALEQEFHTVRTGRANPAALDSVVVEAYGVQMSIKQMATITTPDARSISVSPFDRNQLGAIERAIIAANLGFNPNNDGSVIHVNVPPMTEERRKEMAKLAHKMAEDARIAIRHVRKHANDAIKKHEDAKDMPEDELKQAHKGIQDLTDDYIKRVDEKVKKKDKEIMEV
jgi:ribosome recycling factor